MSRILNTDDSKFTLAQFDLSDNETSGTIVVRTIPADRYKLQALPVDADMQVQGRENGTMDAWVDLATSPIDLSGYAEETPRDFDIRVVSGAPLVGVRRVAVHLSVSSDGAAGW